MQKTVKPTFSCRDKISLETLENAGHDGQHGLDSETSRWVTFPVALEDLHSADPEQAKRRFERSPRMGISEWVVTTRPTIENQKPETILNAVSVPKRLVLGSLNEDADEQVLRDILGADIDHELLDFAARAGGNPRLLAELALGLAEEGLVKKHNGTIQLTGRRIPHRFLAFVKRRMGDLSTNCQQFLKVAAVLGRSFMLEDASRMLDRSSATLLPPLDEAIASGFVVAAEHQLAFQSDFLWRGVIDSIPAPARGALHREAMGHSWRRTQAHDQQFRMTESPAEPSNGVKEEAGGVCARAQNLIMSGKAIAGIRVAKRILSSPSISASARLDAEASVILGYFLLGKEEVEKHSARILRERRTGQGDIAAVMALTALYNARWRVGELAEGLSPGHTAVRSIDHADPVRGVPAPSSGGVDEGWSSLSDMERRIAYLVSVGLTNRQIAKRVHLSAHTVNYHLRKVYRKLGINTRAELSRGVAIYSIGDEEKRGSGKVSGDAR